MIRLKNLRPAPSTYEIPISAGFGSVRHAVHTIRYSLEPNNDGTAQGSADLKAARVEMSRQFPQSLTLMAKGTAGDTSAPLPDGLRHVDPFKSLIAKRQLAVIEIPEEQEPDTTVPSATPLAGPKLDPVVPVQVTASGEVSKASDAPIDVPPAASGTDGSAPADTFTEAPITGRSTNKRGR